MKRPFASIGFTYLIARFWPLFFWGVGASFAQGISCLTLAVLLFCRKSTERRFPCSLFHGGSCLFTLILAFVNKRFSDIRFG